MYMRNSMGYNISESEDNIRAQLNFQLFLEKMMDNQEEAFNYLKQSNLSDQTICIAPDDNLIPQSGAFKVR